jgi:hypothetical protein
MKAVILTLALADEITSQSIIGSAQHRCDCRRFYGAAARKLGADRC